MNLLSLYEKLEKLVQKLPAPLQSPILREISPIKTLFLQQRPPRILLLGDRAASRTALVNALFGAEVAHASEDHLQDGAWQLFSHGGRGRLRLLDARRPAALSLLGRALGAEAPDISLFLHMEPRTGDDIAADLDHAAQVLRLAHERTEAAEPALFGVAVGSVLGGSAADAFAHLHTALGDSARHAFVKKLAGIFVLPAGPAEAHRLAAAIAKELPGEAKLEMARLSGAREVQREIAQVVIKSMSAICGAVGAQPIPLADFPIITALQATMVAGIMHISGREMNAKLGREFLGAVGANVGVGLVLREGARAAMKLLPIWGDIVAGGVAAAGTYAVGRAAAEYFIEGKSLKEARGLFKRARKDKALLKEGAPDAE